VIVDNEMTRRTQGEALVAEHAERRRDRFRESLRAGRTLLIDADPMRVSMNLNAELSAQLLADLQARWTALRSPLEGVAIIEDDDLRFALSELFGATSGVQHREWLGGRRLPQQSRLARCVPQGLRRARSGQRCSRRHRCDRTLSVVESVGDAAELVQGGVGISGGLLGVGVPGQRLDGPQVLGPVEGGGQRRVSEPVGGARDYPCLAATCFVPIQIVAGYVGRRPGRPGKIQPCYGGEARYRARGEATGMAHPRRLDEGTQPTRHDPEAIMPTIRPHDLSPPPRPLRS